MLKKAIVPILILVGGILLTVLIVRSRPEVEKVAIEIPPPIVRYFEVQPTSVTIEIPSQGTVRPATSANLVAEVSGSIRGISPNFEDGGFIREGEVLVELDARDYELNVESAKASVAQAEVALAREQAEAEIARREWEELGEGEATPLVLREPQVAQAEAALDAAQASLARAQLDLERTQVVAPFDGRVRTQHVDRGEFVNRGTPLASIYSVDTAEVLLPVPDAELAFLDLGLRPGNRAQPRVTLSAVFAGARHEWPGRIVRSGGEIDPSTRMIQLIAEIARPYEPARVGAPPLSVGLFVDASIQGKSLENVFEVPRSVLREDDLLLVIDEQDRLRFRRVSVVRRTASTVLIDGGLQPGERICVTALEAAVDGMAVTPERSEPTDEPALTVGSEETGTTEESGSSEKTPLSEETR